jgi:hypothetical protein
MPDQVLISMKEITDIRTQNNSSTRTQMNTPLRRKNFKAAIVAILLIAIGLLAGSPGTASVATTDSTPACRDSILIQKKITSRSHRISLYPDADQKVVFFSVRGVQGKVYQLYMFDVTGKLISQTEIRNRQTTLIKNIEKGVYLFDVFCDDDRIGNGQIAVR